MTISIRAPKITDNSIETTPTKREARLKRPTSFVSVVPSGLMAPARDFLGTCWGFLFMDIFAPIYF